MPATTVRPGRCIKAQLLANGPMATSDLHFAYKEEIRVKRQSSVDGLAQRGMHSDSFRRLIYFAKRLGYLVETGLEDALGLRGDNATMMTMIRRGEVVPSQRILYGLTPAGEAAVDEWDNLRQAFVNALAGGSVSQETAGA